MVIADPSDLGHGKTVIQTRERHRERSRPITARAPRGMYLGAPPRTTQSSWSACVSQQWLLAQNCILAHTALLAGPQFQLLHNDNHP